MRRADFRAEHGGFAAKAHRANFQGVGFFRDALFQSRKLGVRIFILQTSQQSFLGYQVSAAAVAANRHAQKSRRAALTLCLVNRIENDFAHAFQVAVSAESDIGQGILPADVFASAAFEHQINS